MNGCYCDLPFGLTESFRQRLLTLRRQYWDRRISKERENLLAGKYDGPYRIPNGFCSWRDDPDWVRVAASLGVSNLGDNCRPHLLDIQPEDIPKDFQKQVHHLLGSSYVFYLILDTYPHKCHPPHWEVGTLKLNFLLSGDLDSFVSFHEADSRLICIQKYSSVGAGILFNAQKTHTVWNPTDDTRMTLMIGCRVPEEVGLRFEEHASNIIKRAEAFQGSV